MGGVNVLWLNRKVANFGDACLILAPDSKLRATLCSTNASMRVWIELNAIFAILIVALLLSTLPNKLELCLVATVGRFLADLISCRDFYRKALLGRFADDESEGES